MSGRAIASYCVALLAVCAIGVQYRPAVAVVAAAPQSDRPQLPATYIPSGKQMFNDYCASCHGPDGKGLGPVAPLFRRPPADLTLLAKSHGGVFPRQHITTLLRFGPGIPGHGSSDMPVWGPVFRIIENYNETAVNLRIKNLCDYIESIQGK